MNLWNLHRGASPLIVDVPHAGTFIPDALRRRLTPAALAVPDTDWYVDQMCDFVPNEGATLLCATHSRYVVDLNRDPSGAFLYIGADNTEYCPIRTFANEPIYLAGELPAAPELARRLAEYFDPYHATLAAEIERVRARHGFAIVLDAHSIPAHCPRFFAGRLPDLNLGTADGASCTPELQARAAGVIAAASGFSHIVNGRFKGGYITRHYGRPAEAMHTVQIETAQACYMNEVPPHTYDPAKAAPFIEVLRQLVNVLSTWRPGA